MIDIDQEPDQFPRRPLSGSALVVFLAIIGCVIATIALERGHIIDVLHITTTPPARIDRTPDEDPTEAEQMREDADLRLTTYGWVDRKAGLIHVPLSIAIDRYLESVK